ncbi:MAG: hypothetical protein ACK4TP_14250 [Hyphomicrobium sp.]|jgi:hypothetical protein
MTAWLWLLVVVVGAAALGAFILYGQEKSEERQPLDATLRRDAATREAYRKAERGED